MEADQEGGPVMGERNRCTPHSWKLPVPGDAELECVQCGRRLHWHFDITPNMRAAIINSVERHIDTYEFQGFFGYGPLADAFEAARPPVDTAERPEETRRKASFDHPAPAPSRTFADRRRKPGEGQE